MASNDYAIEAHHPSDNPHILAHASARSGAGDKLLSLRNGPDAADEVAALDKDGNVLVGDGAVGRPGIQFLSDADTGFYRIGADNVGLALNGSKVVDYQTSLVNFLKKLDLEEELVTKELGSDPSSPSAGDRLLYAKSDGIYEKNSSGTEVRLAKASELMDPSVPTVPWGSGADGDVTLSSNTTLQSDKSYSSLTINAGVTLDTNGYRVFVDGTLTNNGTIQNNGGAGSNGSDGADGGGGGAGGSGGSAASGNNLSAGTSGASGGRGSDAQSSNHQSGGNGTSVNPGLGSDGAAGGSGGGNSAGSGGSGGSAGTVTSESAGFSGVVIPIIGSQVDAKFGITLHGVTSGASLSPSAGSGGGGGGRGDTGSGGGGGGGGGAGGSGGVVYVAAETLDNGSGTIQANGGDGGDGGAPGTGGNNDARGGGGGAGGPGGVVILTYSSLTSGTEQALGGSGGTGGDSASDGSDGTAGKVYKVAV